MDKKHELRSVGFYNEPGIGICDRLGVDMEPVQMTGVRRFFQRYAACPFRVCTLP